MRRVTWLLVLFTAASAYAANYVREPIPGGTADVVPIGSKTFSPSPVITIDGAAFRLNGTTTASGMSSYFFFDLVDTPEPGTVILLLGVALILIGKLLRFMND